MSDTSTQEGASHRQGGRGRNRRGGRNRSSGGSGNNRGSRGPSQGRDYEFKPDRKPKQSGFQKLLSVLTFGILGKPKARPARPSAASSNAPARDSKPAASRPERTPRPPRAPQPPAEVTTDRLYVGNLSYDASESDLFELFNGVGQVKNCEVVVNNRTQRSKGFAFVTMASVEQTKRAVDELNGKEFMGRQLQVNGAKPPSADRGDRRERDDEASAPEAEEAAAS